MHTKKVHTHINMHIQINSFTWRLSENLYTKGFFIIMIFIRQRRY